MPEFPYQRFYDSLAWIYGAAMRAIRPWLAYARQSLPWLPTEGRVLEIGHGPGLLLEELASRYALAAGLDLSLGMIRQARRRLQRAGLPARLVRGDAVALPYRTGSFDGIVATFTLSAIPDGGAAMREMARVLRPGGMLSLVDACLPPDGNLVGTALARLWTLLGDHMRHEAELMRQAGFEVVERREFGAFHGIRLVAGRKP